MTIEFATQKVVMDRRAILELISTSALPAEEEIPPFDLTTPTGCLLHQDFKEILVSPTIARADCKYLSSFPGELITLTVWQGRRVLVPSGYVEHGLPMRPLRGYLESPV